MALSSLFCSISFIPTSILTSTRNTLSLHTCFPSASCNIPHKQCKRDFPLPLVASVPYQPINFDYLEEEFSGHGVTFEAVGDNCIAKMELKNGSIATMMLPSGLITSYKTPMWHGGKVELLHTAVSEGEYGDAIIQGGVSLNFKFQTDDGELSFSPTNWVLHKINGNPKESIKVELINRSSDDKIGLKYIVTLEEDALSSELEISNSKSLALHMTGSILSHLTVSSPEATYAIGLERSNYCSKPPLESEFMLSPANSSQEEGFGKIWNSATEKIFPTWSTKSQNNGAEGRQRNFEEMDEEMDNYKKLCDNISLVYTDAPRSFTVIDRGRRNSVSIGRNGFDEMYLFSPGSRVEIYSKYSYICVGQAAILKPIILSPQDVWRGGQYLHNPNL
ncbi:protein NDH-DEPENDENT CYCLIC ELECTRON FLOW 5 [Abrus precatorius]|uniref:Protein NDH-DEPENDENT CYCLIC ELECTRON FLOW 5 n=1 Tax=Abrus precatorius TaxID=3816 RepID=A0A8B8LS32_ABRPR|nr:protein NDH-DEPENDENT CYCLIC ELECTRON FLOW 5 [Abrus precatorius]